MWCHKTDDMNGENKSTLNSFDYLIFLLMFHPKLILRLFHTSDLMVLLIGYGVYMR